MLKMHMINAALVMSLGGIFVTVAWYLGQFNAHVAQLMFVGL